MRLSKMTARGCGIALGGFPQQHAQIVGHRLEDAGGQPAPGLLVDGLPRREVGRQQPPGRAGAHDPAQGVEDLAQVVTPLRGVFPHQRQVGGHEGPFVITHVGRIGLAGLGLGVHPPSLPSP